MTTFSVTEMDDKEACRRRWYNGSLNGMAREPWLPAKPLILGTIDHAVMADWSVAWHHGERSLAFPVEAFDKHMAVAKQAIYSRYSQKYGGSADPEDEENFIRMDDAEWETLYGNDVEKLGRHMIANYVEFYGEPYPSHHYTLVEVEQTITVPVPGTDHCRCCVPDASGREAAAACTCGRCVEGPRSVFRTAPGQPSRQTDLCTRYRPCECVTTHFLEGTFDMLLADPKGRLVVPDHKTYEKRPSEMENAQNAQFLRYQWIVSQALPGAECVATLYNGLWKRFFPVLGKDGRKLKNSSGAYYELEDLFFRDLIPHSQEEIAEIGYYLPTEILEMERARLDPRLRWPHRSWATCPGCGMQDLCVAMTRDEPLDEFDADFTQREKTPAWRAAV